MFEKSLYDLIRGLRQHKGNEREFINNSLRECRKEIRGSDMNLKTTALLKLIYLEMFGHDMSWASFNVLEVMSSPKYPQKRVGYLGTVQSFRPDTEVLMLATNLLKKDIASASIPTISLPLITLPHLLSPSLALSLFNDLLPRLSHSSPYVKKKAIVTIYRLALVYPEALRLSWPKIKDILMDEHQDPSVTAAVINVMCEFGLRRPQDILPLSPRLFELLIEGKNNWMGIKIIKLFATLTPLEPRLIKKLLPPLRNLIQTTSAMSLLYECINGIVHGGILEGCETSREREQVAELCVEKLRGMIAEGDPNLKYVALLAFNKIATFSPQLVSLQEDVIIDCISDEDVSIRLQALQLASGIVHSGNLTNIVGRLIEQLKIASRVGNIKPDPTPVPDDDDAQDTATEIPFNESAKSGLPDHSPPLSVDYRNTVIRHVLEMASRDNYSHVQDFEWYIDTLRELANLAPADTTSNSARQSSRDDSQGSQSSSKAIGAELRNVGVRVESVRKAVVLAALSLISPQEASSQGGAALYAIWLIGEYCNLLPSKKHSLDILLIVPATSGDPKILRELLQAISKLVASILASESLDWKPETQSAVTMLLAKVIRFLERFTSHADLEVQELAVEFVELFRLAQEAVEAQASTDDTAPFLISSVIPSLFNSTELKPVAPSAQKKIPLPDTIDLTVPINSNLHALLQESVAQIDIDKDIEDLQALYFSSGTGKSAGSLLSPNVSTFQEKLSPSLSGNDTASKARNAARVNDPFYIGADSYQTAADRLQGKSANGSLRHDIDVDSIPIMDLEIDSSKDDSKVFTEPTKPRVQVHRPHVSVDETFDLGDSHSSGDNLSRSFDTSAKGRQRRGLLGVDSSNIGAFSLDVDEATAAQGIHDQPVDDDKEMASALKEVERLRMEMQRAAERIQVPEDIPAGGAVVKKKKKKKKVKKEEQPPAAGTDDA